VERGQVELAAELLAHRARVNLRDQFGRTPLRMLRDNQDPKSRQLVKLLREHGAVE